MRILANVVNVFVDQNRAHGNPLGIVWAGPETRGHEQQIAADLGFSETIFIDELTADTVRARIFTPARELPFAGHPTVGLAAWLRDAGDGVRSIEVPAGSARVRYDGELVFVNAMPQWTPEFEFYPLDTPAEVEAVDPAAYGSGMHYVWAWIDERDARIRSRMFAPELGIREDEATGAAAVRLSAVLGRDLEIVQGRGSLIHTHVRYLGQQVEVGGRVVEAAPVELR